jgi:hypothetical protein
MVVVLSDVKGDLLMADSASPPPAAPPERPPFKRIVIFGNVAAA